MKTLFLFFMITLNIEAAIAVTYEKIPPDKRAELKMPLDKKAIIEKIQLAENYEEISSLYDSAVFSGDLDLLQALCEAPFDRGLIKLHYLPDGLYRDYAAVAILRASEQVWRKATPTMITEPHRVIAPKIYRTHVLEVSNKYLGEGRYEYGDFETRSQRFKLATILESALFKTYPDSLYTTQLKAAQKTQVHSNSEKKTFLPQQASSGEIRTPQKDNHVFLWTVIVTVLVVISFLLLKAKTRKS